MGLCLLTPLSYCHWPWVYWFHGPKNQTVGAPCGSHGPTSSLSCCSKNPKSSVLKTLDLEEPGCPQMLPPLTEKAASTCALPGPAWMSSSCIFFYFLTDWTLHTLTQDFVLDGVGSADGVSHVNLLSP